MNKQCVDCKKNISFGFTCLSCSFHPKCIFCNQKFYYRLYLGKNVCLDCIYNEISKIYKIKLKKHNE